MLRIYLIFRHTHKRRCINRQWSFCCWVQSCRQMHTQVIYINKRKINQAMWMFFRFLLEYGRSCKDIGCLPSETCQMSFDTCSYSQTEGKECGGYPTCKRNANGASNSPGNLIFKINIHARFIWHPEYISISYTHLRYK